MNIRKCLLTTVSLIFAFLLNGVLIAQGVLNEKKKPDKPNILFIAVDDLGPELGCYGKSQIKSPNIDRLARMGMVFKNAYASVPNCGPSRASLLSGIYPTQTCWRGWNCSQDKDVPGIVSLSMHFRNNNYYTVSLGKIFNNFDDGKGSWDMKWRAPLNTTDEWDYQSEEGIRICEEANIELNKDTGLHNYQNTPKRGLAFEKPDVPDNAYLDGRLANRAIEELQTLQNNSQPFFLAVGFWKPHLPFNAPEKYWKMYDESEIQFPDNPYFPKNSPEAVRYNSGELRGFYGMPKEFTLPDTLAHNLIHGYYACVSYVDAQIGRVINALEGLGMADNTFIILWGDHGWFLREHGFWSKYANFRRATHAPLIVKAPWKTSGLESGGLVEFVDIYPTLCDLAGLSKPFHLQGKSFAPLIDQPDQSWKEAVFCRAGDGESIFTQTHAYTEYIKPETGKSYACMLYDLRVDPEENENVADLPENRVMITSLHEKLQKHLKERDLIKLK